MKTPILIPILCTAVCLTALLAFGCSTTGSEFDGQELIELRFTRPSYSADQPLVLRAIPSPDLDPKIFRETPLMIHMTSSSGDPTSAQFSPWSDLSDEEMVEAIKDGPGNVILRIKEAGQESARNSRGELVRSEEAMKRFIEWVETNDRLLISWVGELHPNVVVEFIELPTVDLVQQLRTHENVEFMEPDQYGWYLSALATSGGAEPAEDIVSITFPGESFTYLSGETVTAEFQQADGTVLQASVPISE